MTFWKTKVIDMECHFLTRERFMEPSKGTRNFVIFVFTVTPIFLKKVVNTTNFY